MGEVVLVTPDVVGKMLRLKTSGYVTKFADRHNIPYIMSDGVALFKVSDVLDYIERCRVAPAQKPVEGGAR